MTTDRSVTQRWALVWAAALGCSGSRVTAVPSRGVPLRAGLDAAVATATVGPRVAFGAGLSQLGRATDEAHFEERPPRAARLGAFALDRDEVARGAYMQCVAAGQCQAPRCEGSVTESVRCVPWAEAARYCAYAGGRLPTEAEWERAAAGPLPGHRAYVWGELAPATGEPPDETPEGVRGLARGLAEWVLDGGDFYPPLPRPASLDAGADAGAEGSLGDAEAVDVGERTDEGLFIFDDPRGPPRSPWRVVRGGDARTPLAAQQTTLRRFREPDDALPWVGFRCAYPGAESAAPAAGP